MAGNVVPIARLSSHAAEPARYQLMMGAGLRNMTVSVGGAQLLAFCTSVVAPMPRVQQLLATIVFPECFAWPHAAA